MSCWVACRFAQDKALMAAKESRKIILLYNRVARALVEFEVRELRLLLRAPEHAYLIRQSALPSVWSRHA